MGVPQGCVLSVSLFGIKINDIVKDINSGTNCALWMTSSYVMELKT